MSADAIERSIDQIEFPLAVGQSSSYRRSNFVGPLSFPLAVKQPDNKHLWSNFLIFSFQRRPGALLFQLHGSAFRFCWQAAWQQAEKHIEVIAKQCDHFRVRISGCLVGKRPGNKREDASQKGSPSNSLCYLKKDLSRKVPNRKAKRVAQQQGKNVALQFSASLQKCKEKRIVTAGTPETEF